MQNYAYKREGRAVNPEALHGELKAAISAKFTGVSLDPDEVTLHFAAPLSPFEESELVRVMDAHDGEVQTDEQLAKLQEEAAKEDFVKAPPLDVSKVTLASLAERVVQLEEQLKKLIG